MRILIADDHPLLLAGIRQVLENDGGFEVVAEGRDGTEVLSLVDKTQPEVVLLDMRMPGLDGLSCLEGLRSRFPNVFVVMCSASSEPEQVLSAFKRGACGYVIKSVDLRDLGPAIRLAVEGTAYHALGLPLGSTDKANPLRA